MATREADRPPQSSLRLLHVTCVMGVIAAVLYGTSITLPFIGDDYVFLDLTRTRDLLELLGRVDTHFGWYRPLSRDVHFWVLRHVFGATPWAFRLTNIALWITGLGLYFQVVRGLSGDRIAVIATLGGGLLALWGTPLLWVSGSQDLWMFVLVMLTLLAFRTRRNVIALGCYVLSLLSKETAAVVPLILAGHAYCIERMDYRRTLQRVLPFIACTLVWVLLHPTLLHRIAHPQSSLPELRDRPGFVMIALKSAGSIFNLDLIPYPTDIDQRVLARWLAAVAATAAATLWLLGRANNPTDGGARVSANGGVLAFAAVWTLSAWFPVFLPSIGWHAYYGCVGAMGAWFMIAHIFPRNSGATATLLACLAFLECAHASTQSWDWGNEWYQRRAGTILNAIRDDLLRQHTHLPPHTRVFFGHIPNNIGLIAGSSAAIRVWYDEPTLKAGFYSYYRPRMAGEPMGQDLFFRLDTLTGMVEIRHATEALPYEMIANPNWEADHEALAMTMLRGGSPAEAAAEFMNIARLAHRGDALVLASVCKGLSGDSDSARLFLDSAAVRMTKTRTEIAAWAETLKKHLPAPLSALPSGSGFD